jgi:thioredoxin 1
MSSTQSVNTTNFDTAVLGSDLPVLVDFWATWCGPCHRVAPEVEAVAEQLTGRARVYKLDVDESPQLAQEYGVQSIPTLLIIKGGKLVDQVVGAVPRTIIAQKLEAQL